MTFTLIHIPHLLPKLLGFLLLFLLHSIFFLLDVCSYVFHFPFIVLIVFKIQLALHRTELQCGTCCVTWSPKSRSQDKILWSVTSEAAKFWMNMVIMQLAAELWYNRKCFRRGEECQHLNFRLLFPDYFNLWNNLKIHPRSLKSLRVNFWFLILILLNIFLLICFQERCFLPTPANYLSRFRNSFCMSEVAFWLKAVFYLLAFSLLATCCLVGVF